MFIVNMVSTTEKIKFDKVLGKTNLEGLAAFRYFRNEAYVNGLANYGDLAKVVLKSDGTFVAIIGHAKIYSV